MTPEEFIEKIANGARIKCDTIQQRRTVLEFFDERGFSIGPNTREMYLEIPVEQDRDSSYMHPGYDRHREYIVVYSSTFGSQIKYEDIADIVEISLPLDNRSDADFERDFALLCC